VSAGPTCQPVEPAATVGAAIEHVSKGSRGVVTVAGCATIGTVVCTTAVSVAAEPLLGTIVISIVTAVAVATIVVVAIVIAVIAVVAVVVAIVVGIVLAVVVAVAVAIIIAVAPTIVVIVVVVVAIVAEHGSHHILQLGSHGSLAGLKISFPVLEAVGYIVNRSGGRRRGRRRWLDTWREFCTLFV
jgi:hypothetical protein